LSPRSDPTPLETLAQVHTVALTLEEDTVPVSRELLAIRSPYFETIFYRAFVEKINGIFEIKEVSYSSAGKYSYDLIFSYNSFCRIFVVENAIIALSYADRFGFTDIHQEAFTFLKKQSLPNEVLKEMFIICSRFKENEDMIKWILDQYKSEEVLLALIHDCVPFVSTRVIQTGMMV
ncbi:hypothetical protein PMAYCL1PPCAC_20307, partial [Pristionchus mayeri]